MVVKRIVLVLYAVLAGCTHRVTTPPPAADIEVAIAKGAFCARIGGKVHCGIGDDVQPLARTAPLGGIEDATSLALGADFGCLTTKRGTVHCWGSNASAELGAHVADERSDALVQVVGVTDAKRVFAGAQHACATTNAGTLYCWGLNLWGETGGSTSWAPGVRELATPNAVSGVGDDVETVTLGAWSTCAVTKSRDVHCWGESVLPEQTDAQGRRNEHPFRIASLAGTEDVSIGHGAVCGVRRGDVFCRATSSPLGDEHAADAIAKGFVKDVVKVRVDGSHACALVRDGRVMCWSPERPPQPVAGITARDLVVGHGRWCAITNADEVACWGRHDGPQRIRIR